MVKLKDTKIKKCQGEAYFRCFGNKGLASILSRSQALVIKYGYDLEEIIMLRVNRINDLDKFLKDKPNGIYVAPKKIIKKSDTVRFEGVEPDFMIFITKNDSHECHIVELKDGCEFDTKSSEAELKHLNEFIDNNAKRLQYTFDGHICCFNEETRDGIIKGFKNKITSDIALTGKEFCKLLEIDYEEITSLRKKHREDNLNYFCQMIMEDNTVQKKLKSLLNKDKK